MIIDPESIQSLVQRALREDLGRDGDITSLSIFQPGVQAEAIIKSKESGVLSGGFLMKPVFREISEAVVVSTMKNDGDALMQGEVICFIRGPISGILAGERVVLNFLQRLSGIATYTAELVRLLEGTGTRLLDTRKTTPTLRLLEKKAVVDGGGVNHRFGLFDMILIKDTHVKAAGGPGPAVVKAREYCLTHPDIRIEVEVQTLEEFKEAGRERPDRIMLDNMSIGEMQQCVSYKKDNNLIVELEASGNITRENIRSVARTGVDFISVGAITHSVKALDIHLTIV
jgi:nicotinate-nucleotide pyrophosphorylase (carboxylating)